MAWLTTLLTSLTLPFIGWLRKLFTHQIGQVEMGCCWVVVINRRSAQCPLVIAPYGLKKGNETWGLVYPTVR